MKRCSDRRDRLTGLDLEGITCLEGYLHWPHPSGRCLLF